MIKWNNNNRTAVNSMCADMKAEDFVVSYNDISLKYTFIFIIRHKL